MFGVEDEWYEECEKLKTATAPCPYHDPGEPCRLRGATGCCYEMPCDVEMRVPVESTVCEHKTSIVGTSGVCSIRAGMGEKPRMCDTNTPPTWCPEKSRHTT